MKFINQFCKSHKKEIFLFFLMLALELVMIFVLSQINGIGIFSRNDANEFRIIVKNVIDYGVFSLEIEAPFFPTNFRTPGYPLFLSIIYLIFFSFKPAIFIGAAIFALSAPLVYLIAKEIFTEKIAFISAILFAIEPWALFQSGFLVAEQIFMPFFLLSVYLFCRYLKSEKRNYLYSAVFLQGLAALTRPISIFFILIFLIFIFIIELKSSLRQSAKTMALALAIFILVLSPWLIRNKIVLNTWQVSSISNINLFIENYAMLEKYLGKMKQDEDIYEIARILLGTRNDLEIFRIENSKILAGVALKEIKENAGSYAIMHLKALPGFLVRNSYGNIFLDLKVGGSDIQGKLGRQFFSGNFSGFFDLTKNSPAASKILLILFLFWPIIILFVAAGIIWGFKNYRRNLLFWFLIFWPLYFLALAGNLRDISRYKLTINAPLFMFASLGFYKIYNYFFKL